MPTNYDRIARFYDFLNRVVFGKSIIRAQEGLLPYIPAGSRILIAGGGTGWILESIATLHPKGLIIDYLESSARMIDISMKRGHKANQVNFIHDAIESYQYLSHYDVIITPFLFDNLPKEKIDVAFPLMNDSLKSGGLWLYADFVSGQHKPLWQKILLKTMYTFFSITSDIETMQLIDMSAYFRLDFSASFQADHYAGFIRSVVYHKK